MTNPKAIQIKGAASSNFIATMMIDSYGIKALDKCSKDSPMYRSVEAELKLRGELEND